MKTLTKIIPYIFLAIAGFSTAEVVNRHRVYHRFLDRTYEVANTDGVGLKPDPREMAILYGEIRKPYDPMNPAKLSISEMDAYLSGKGIKLNKYGIENK